MANGNLLASIAETDFRLVQGPSDPIGVGSLLVHEVPFLDATVAETLRLAALASVIVYNPHADTIEYTGTWCVSDVVTIKDGKGSVTLRETLTKVTSVAVAADLPAPIVKTQTDEILNLFGLQPGGSMDMVWQYLYLNPQDVTAIELVPANITPPAGTILVNGSPVAFTYTGAKHVVTIEEKGDRTATLSILWSGALWPNSTPTPVITSESPQDDTVTETFFGVPLAQAAANVQTLKLIEGTELCGFVDNGKGEATITRRRKLITELSEDGYLLAELTFDTYFGTTNPIKIALNWSGLRKADADTLITTLVAAGVLTFAGPTDLYGITGTFNITYIGLDDNDSSFTVRVVCSNPQYIVWADVNTEILGYKREKRTGALGTNYTWVVNRKMFTTQAAAIVYADASGPVPAYARGENQITAIAHGGDIDWNDQLKKYVAFQETWTSL